MKKMTATLVALLFVLPLFAQEQTTPPAPSAPREAKLPQPVEKTLANGLRVIVVPKHDVPLVAASLVVKAGGQADPRDRAGLAELTAALLTKGTRTRTAEEIARGVEALGATLSSGAEWDASTVDLSVMSSNFARAMEYVADVALHPAFRKDELDRERQQTIDSLQVALGQPGSLASFVLARLVFADAPYGNLLSGTPASLPRITRDDVLRFHRAHYQPSNAVLVVAGDVKPEALFALSEQLFGKWKQSETKAATGAKATVKPQRRIVVVDMPEAGQAAVAVGRQGIRRADGSYMPAIVTNSVLGGGYSARLNQEIRIRRGLSYGARSSFSPRREAGPFTASTQTKNESAAEVAGIIVDEMNRLGSVDVTDAELTPRKAVLMGEFARSLETTAGIVNEVSTFAMYDLPLTDLNRYISGVQAVDAPAVRGFAKSGLATDQASVVIVGDAKKFIEPLRARFENVEVISAGDLDLDSPTLRVRKQKE